MLINAANSLDTIRLPSAASATIKNDILAPVARRCGAGAATFTAGIINTGDVLSASTRLTAMITLSAVLDRYRDDNRVMHVSGNFYQRRPVGTAAYYFSRIPHIWGWATWRRGLAVTPNVSLVSNIGYGPRAVTKRFTERETDR